VLSKRTQLSKQTLSIWHRSVQQDASTLTGLYSVSIAILLHLGFIVAARQFENASTQSAPKQQSVRVEIRSRPQESSNDINTPPTDRATELNTKPKPRVLSTAQSDPQKKTHSVPKQSEPEKPATRSIPPPKREMLSERQSPLLPAGKFDFIEKQRQIGEVLGAGAVAGDLAFPDVVTNEDPDSGVRATEYTFAGYFSSLSRRFAEAWGGVRTLPPQSQFDGKLGEFIEYDVVINRDGSLRKIVNVTAKREPYRDFSAVDGLVEEVFNAMFPFQPVPERIKNDPLVVRKRIQFVGFKYTLY
jgi:hypothetical protein